jgi:hypothetical protein
MLRGLLKMAMAALALMQAVPAWAAPEQLVALVIGNDGKWGKTPGNICRGYRGEAAGAAPSSFKTPAAQAPQDEGICLIRNDYSSS